MCQFPFRKLLTPKHPTAIETISISCYARHITILRIWALKVAFLSFYFLSLLLAPLPGLLIPFSTWSGHTQPGSKNGLVSPFTSTPELVTWLDQKLYEYTGTEVTLLGTGLGVLVAPTVGLRSKVFKLRPRFVLTPASRLALDLF